MKVLLINLVLSVFSSFCFSEDYVIFSSIENTYLSEVIIEEAELNFDEEILSLSSGGEGEGLNKVEFFFFYKFLDGSVSSVSIKMIQFIPHKPIDDTVPYEIHSAFNFDKAVNSLSVNIVDDEFNGKGRNFFLEKVLYTIKFHNYKSYINMSFNETNRKNIVKRYNVFFVESEEMKTFHNKNMKLRVFYNETLELSQNIYVQYIVGKSGYVYSKSKIGSDGEANLVIPDFGEDLFMGPKFGKNLVYLYKKNVNEDPVNLSSDYDFKMMPDSFRDFKIKLNFSTTSLRKIDLELYHPDVEKLPVWYDALESETDTVIFSGEIRPGKYSLRVYLDGDENKMIEKLIEISASGTVEVDVAEE